MSKKPNETSIIFARVSIVPVLESGINREAIGSLSIDSDDAITLFDVTSKLQKATALLFQSPTFQALGGKERSDMVRKAFDEVLDELCHNIESLSLVGHHALTGAVDALTDALETAQVFTVGKIEVVIPPRNDDIGGARVESPSPDGGPEDDRGPSLEAAAEPVDSEVAERFLGSEGSGDGVQGSVSPAA